MTRRLMILIIVLCASSTAFAETIFVPDDYTTIQAAIIAAKSGDTVVVKPGTYHENIHFLGKAITLRSEQGREFTVIDGNQSGSVISIIGISGEESLIDGFTLTNGTGDSHKSYASGGGIFCLASSITISNNTICNNSSEYGGGIFISGAISDTHLIINNIIRQNAAEYDAGGIWCDHSSASITKNIICDNWTNYGGSRGGGIWCRYSAATIFDNIITGNAGITGGGIHCWFGDSSIIINNYISRNVAETGGGIYCAASSTPIIVNNIISGNWAVIGGGLFTGGVSSPPPMITNNTIFRNTAYEKGGGYFCVNGSSPEMNNIILWSNEAPIGPEMYVGVCLFPSKLTIRYSTVQGGRASVHVDQFCELVWGDGMIDGDPLFVDPLHEDFHLTVDSPCIDSGINDRLDIAGTDYEGDPRSAFKNIDMGADEFYSHLYYAGNAEPGNPVDLKIIGPPLLDGDVLLCIGSDVIDPFLISTYGAWYLRLPVFIHGIGAIPKNGVISLHGRIPHNFPAPSSVPMQALIGAELTNLCVLEVK